MVDWGMRKAEGIEQRAEGNTAGSIVIRYSLLVIRELSRYELP